MSRVEIVDGIGDTFRAGVNEYSRLDVASSSVDEDHVRALRGRTYIVGVGPVAFQSGMVGPALILRNENSRLITISEIMAGSDPSLSQVGMKYSIIKNPTLGTLGNVAEVEPGNTRFDRGNLPSATAWIWDGAGTGISGVSGGETLQTLILGYEPYRYPCGHSLLLAEGDTIAILALAPAIGLPSFHISLRFYI